MRTLTILFFLVAAVFMACQKDRSLQRGTSPEERIMFVDKFGLADHQFNTTKRAPLSEAERTLRKRPKPEHPHGRPPGQGGGGEDTTGNDGGGGDTTDPNDPPPPPPPPSTDKVILLDFDGYDLPMGSYWNGGAALTMAHSNLSGEQQAAILDSVRWDYRDFDVTVTADEATYQAANPYKRTRVVITESWEWFGMAGGVAYLGSFTWGNETPCFVFSSLLAYSSKYIQEASSHEAGHTLGLYHQAKYDEAGNKLAEYHDGEGMAYAPIMGVAYYQRGEWHIGKDSYGREQNDTLIIGQTLRQ